MDDIEIEIQVRVERIKKLDQFLKKNARFTGKKHQVDEYFTPAYKDYRDKKPIEEWLRIRRSSENSITYKRYHYGNSGNAVHCDEYETKIENADQLRKVITAVGFIPIITVEKKRETWLYKDYEIAIDDVVGQGDFVEIEYKGTDEFPDPKTISYEMIEFLKKLGCGKIEKNNGGYAFVALYPSEAEFIEV